MIGEKLHITAEALKPPLLDRLPVFYTPKLVAEVPHTFSRSASKPAQVVAGWGAQGFPIRIESPAPVSRDQLAAAHDPDYVDGVLCGYLKNGFDDQSTEVAQSLPYTSGAMLAAAGEAIRNGRAAVAPVSGFHHACYATGGGYCTFNGLLVAAIALKEAGVVNRVGILDCDYHNGNGTFDITREKNLDWVNHFSTAWHYRSRCEAETFLEILPSVVEGMSDCGVILYQAGADPHIEDPLGGFLTTEQLRQRDAIVFETAARSGIPLAWNLAGGYQFPFSNVLEIHDNTLKECIRVHVKEQEENHEH